MRPSEGLNAQFILRVVHSVFEVTHRLSEIREDQEGPLCYQLKIDCCPLKHQLDQSTRNS